MRHVMASLLVGGVLIIAAPAAAQVEIEARPEPAAPEARVVPPPLHYETTRPPDTDFYPEGTRTQHDPTFITPFAGQYQTQTGSGRYGLSGWTAPVPPLGPRTMFRELTGYLAFGLSVTWDGPPAVPSGAAR